MMKKLDIVEGYLNGDFSLAEKAKELGYNQVPRCFKLWIEKYKEHGASALMPLICNNTYKKNLKSWLCLSNEIIERLQVLYLKAFFFKGFIHSPFHPHFCSPLIQSVVFIDPDLP